MGPHGQVSPDLAGSAQLDPNCLLTTVNIALLFRTELRAFLFPMSGEQAVWGPGRKQESEATLVSLHLLWTLHVGGASAAPCFSPAPSRGRGDPSLGMTWLPSGFPWGRQQGAEGGRRMKMRRRLPAPSSGGLQGLAGPGPTRTQLPSGPFPTRRPGILVRATSPCCSGLRPGGRGERAVCRGLCCCSSEARAGCPRAVYTQ